LEDRSSTFFGAAEIASIKRVGKRKKRPFRITSPESQADLLQPAAIDDPLKNFVRTTLATTIKRLEVERDEVESKLASIKDSDKIITLHRGAIERYRKDLEKLASLLPRHDLGAGDELGEKVRWLISAVIVHTPPNSEKLEVEIRGRLEELLSAPTFMRRSSRSPGRTNMIWRRARNWDRTFCGYSIVGPRSWADWVRSRARPQPSPRVQRLRNGHSAAGRPLAAKIQAGCRATACKAMATAPFR
jgi:hypothetical protein